MLDRTLPYFGVIMVWNGPAYPRFAPPEGTRLCRYAPGMERDWADVEASVGEFGAPGAALDHFEKEFGPFREELPGRMLFIRDPDGSAAGTATLWRGGHLGEELPRIHWVAVRPDRQRRGLAKALMTGVMDAYGALGRRKPVYLTTQTWSWKAVRLYAAFGFEPYYGEKPAEWDCASGCFEEENRKAWEIIRKKIREEDRA